MLGTPLRGRLRAVSQPTRSATSSESQRESRRSRHGYSSTTARGLVKTAERLFTEAGYAATSLDAIVRNTKVTKGALYHYFGGKQELFESVFDKVESRAAKRIRKALKHEKDPWTRAEVGIRAFLESVQEPEYRRVVMQDGPAVLGYARFQEQGERRMFSIVQDIVGSLAEGTGWDLDPAMVETMSQVMFGAMSQAGTLVASSEDPVAASARVEAAMGIILEGLRALVVSGAEVRLPGDEDA